MLEVAGFTFKVEIDAPPIPFAALFVILGDKGFPSSKVDKDNS